MKVISINLCNYGSTGKIAYGISEKAKENNIDYYVAYPMRKIGGQERENDIFITKKWVWNSLYCKFAKYTSLTGCYSHLHTFLFLRKLDEIKPDIMHLHNLHNSYINISMLFRYIKKNSIKVVWTLHDCWAFTGHCPYFTMVKCNKWKEECGNCAQLNIYPEITYDNTKWMLKKKKAWFSGVRNMIIVSPSRWLANLAEESFLNQYDIRVINNGIDLNMFKPIESNFRQEHGIRDEEYMLLGVSFGWGKRKGLDVFVELADSLSEKFKIVLVGTDELSEKNLPDNIITIRTTQNQKELAEIYTAADLFINPTREDNFPTVNIESLACGTPIVSFKTGGSTEIFDETCGVSVDVNDVEGLKRIIIDLCNNKPFSREQCINRAKMFDVKAKFTEYVDLYREVCRD